MILTERDAKIIETLSSHGILSSTQIGDRFFPGVQRTTKLRRLRRLEKAKLIHRVEGLADGKLAWVSTIEGNRAVGSGYPIKHPNRNTLTHDTLLAEIRMKLDSVGMFESWQPEHLLKSMQPENKYGSGPEPVPDALIVARRPRDETPEFRFPSIALELELFLKERGRYRKLFTHYRSKSKLFALWYFVPTLGLGQTLEAIWNSMPPTYSRAPFFIWSLISEVKSDPRAMKNYASKEQAPMSQFFAFDKERGSSPPAHGDAHAVSGM